MFSFIHARLLPRLALKPVSLLARRSAAVPRVVLSRTFLTGTPRLEFPAEKPKSTTKKTTSATKKTAGKTARKPAKKPARKAVRKATRKTAAKKKVVRKKTAKPTRFRFAPDQKPPKRPGGGRTLYIRDFLRARETSKTLVESQQLLTEASAHYNHLSAAEKLDYQTRAIALKREFDIAYEKWYTTVGPKVIRAVNKSRSLKGKRKLAKPVRLSKTRPAGAFFKFLMGFEPENTSLKPTDRAKAAGVAWRALPDAEKKRYREDANADFAKWKQEHAAQ